MPLPTTEIFAFSEPKIKGGEIRVAINCGAQVLYVLQATRPVWRGLYDHLHREFAGVASAPAAPAVLGGRAGRIIAPARLAAYRQVIAEYQTGRHASWTAACRAVGVNECSFSNWYHRHKHELPAGPVLKPGGRIL